MMKLRGTVAIAGAALIACQGGTDSTKVAEDELSARPVPPDEIAICQPTATQIDERRSLYVTDQAILSGAGEDFTLLNTLNQLASQVGDDTLTGLDLFEQWWDTQNNAPGFGNGPHCQNPFNGYDNQCPRSAEGAQADPMLSAAQLGSYTPIAVVNRFDLAPPDGSNCGEYRIVYGKTSLGTRNLPIFEAKLPNPNPGCGIQACRPVAEFWARLSNVNNPTRRAQLLHRFFYEGLPGFTPVVHIANYAGEAGGGYNGASGQIRTNQFMQGPWNLREFRLEHDARANPPTLTFIPETVKANPFGRLFDGSLPGSNDPLAAKAAAFQRHFLTQVGSLAIDDLNRFNYSVPDEFNAGESHMFGSGPTDYLAQFNNDNGSSPFRTLLDARAQELGLTSDDIVNRAMALSCGGCHQESVGRPMGGSVPNFPGTLGFVHGSEFSTEQGPDGPRFLISPALTDHFLPHRRRVLESYLASSACVVCAEPIDVDGVVARPGDADAEGVPGEDGREASSDDGMTIGGRNVH